MKEKNFSYSVENQIMSIPNNVKLTKREIEILRFIASGYKNKVICEKLFISVRTVETHKTNLIKKLNLNSSVELLCYSVENKKYFQL